MEKDLKINVATLDEPHRRAMEDVIGHELVENQQLIISVIDLAVPIEGSTKAQQSLADWTGVYDGLSDVEIEAIDKVVKTRANLTRKFH